MRQFDELNINNRKIIPIKDFFDDIEGISEADREERKAFAFDLEDLILYFFMLYLTMQEYNLVNADYMKQQLQSKYLEIAKKHGVDVDTDVEGYIKQFAENTVDVTIRNADTPYFLSDDRATLIACNEAQSTFNRQDYINAVKSGKTKKTWLDMKDKRERETHREVGETTIEISDYFLVGNSLMLHAHDNTSEYGRYAEPKELINCRCSIRYS